MIRTTLARFYLRVTRTRGVQESAILDGTGISTTQLEDATHLIEPTQLRRLLRNVSQASAEPGWGFSLGSALGIADLGIVGYALMSCATLGEVRPLWDRFNELIGTLVRNESTIDDWTWCLRLHPIVPLDDVERFCLEQHLAAICRLGRLLPDQALRFREIRLTYPAPVHAGMYTALFECPVRFQSERNEVLFDADQLRLPLATADSEAFAACVARCRDILATLSTGGGLESRIRHELAGCRGPLPKLGEMAAKLGHGDRTFRRMLQREGVNYTGILARHRRDLALEYFRQAFTPKEVGYLLGFNDESSFRRAFRSWMGMSIGQYLASTKEGRPRLS